MTHPPDTLVDIPTARCTPALMSRSRRERRRHGALAAALLMAGGLALSHETAAAQGGTLRVAMTASDIPTTTGMPNNGFEGMRFLGYPVFEGLTLWDLSRSDRLATLRPGLAESYEQMADDKKT